MVRLLQVLQYGRSFLKNCGFVFTKDLLKINDIKEQLKNEQKGYIFY